MESKSVTSDWQEEDVNWSECPSMLLQRYDLQGLSHADPDKAWGRSLTVLLLWFCDLSLVLVLTCHKKNKNNSILAYSAAASHTSLRSADSHSDWGVKKITPAGHLCGGGQLKHQPPSSSSFFFSPFPVSSQCLPFSRPLWWDPLFCFLLFVWVAWKPWQLSSWEGFFFILLVWLGGSEGHKVSIWVGCLTVFMLAFWYMGKSNALLH